MGNEADIARELLKEEKIHTYVPSSKELDRMIAIMNKCMRRKEYDN